MSCRHVGRRKSGVFLFALVFAAACLVLPYPPLTAYHAGAPEQISSANADDELIFLDPNGFIRVYDPVLAANIPEVRWESPIGGWRHIAVGDFNADGDAEIAAVGGNGISLFAVYDPVAEGLDVGQAEGYINGIPWVTLYQEELAGYPYLVAAGEFDLNVPGDEIVLYADIPADQVSQSDDDKRFTIIRATNTPPDGRSWEAILTRDSGNEWTWIDAGNLNGTGTDEVAVIDSEIGNLTIFTIREGTLERIYRHSNLERAWQDGDIGQFVAGGDAELAVGRETVFDAPSLLVIRYDVGRWTDAYAAYHDPPPLAVFLGDLSDNGDDELIVVRSVPSGLAGVPRLFVRDNGNDSYVLQDHPLDADNGYRTGVGGDTDGDGRDEIVVLRNNRIRIFYEPERSSAFEDKDVSAGTRMVLAANLDANGLSGSSRLGATPTSIADSVTSETSSEAHVVRISDTVNGRGVPVSVETENDSTWIRFGSERGTTPWNLEVILDATGIVSGTLRDRILVTAGDESVVNSPYGIDVEMTVKPGATFVPAAVLAVKLGCADDTEETLVPIDIIGTRGVTYTLGLSPPANWATVEPVTGTVPSSATLALDGSRLDPGLATTQLVLTAQIDGAAFIQDADVSLLCAHSQVWMPLVTR